ncbi:uncharacterized protein LOC124343119 isoform X5 [Daphnia pulicaria]|nr:uncharacterized protein LOC124343119 isoform X5 [Daphnia pulicaria]XP_046652198.1 uncharacterized protein LOC124343119 isoform X5 [Daphnia pulicaria]
MEDWYLERLGHQNSRHHLNILLGPREKLTIGRKAGGVVDIVCNGKTVSREHCVLKYVDNCWSIEDLKSMNGVFLNRNRIPANTPTILRERDILGVGAIETTESDYYVFNVLKNTVKDENENDGDLMIVEVPGVSAARDPLEESECRTDPLSNDIEKGKPSDDPDKSETPQGQNVASDDSQHIKIPNFPEVILPSSPIFSEKSDIQGIFIGESCVSHEKTTRACTAEESSTASNSHQQKRSHEKTPVRNDDAKMIPTLSNSKPVRPSLDDAKLKLDCKVVIEGLPKKYLNGDIAHSKATKKRLNGKKRLLLYSSDSDSDNEDSSKNIANHHAKNSLTGVESKGKALKKVTHLNERTSSSEDSSDDDALFSSNAASVCKVPKSVFVVEKLSREAGSEQRIPSCSGRMGSASAPQIENLVEDSDDCAVVKANVVCGKRNDHCPESDEDVIILSSGDEETFSSQSRFKQEPLDSPVRKHADDHHGKSPLVVSSSSSDEDSPFFPELSQAFLKEIAEEEEEETSLSKKISRKGTDVDKLNSLVKSGRFNQKGKTILQTEPQNLHTPVRGRSSLATAGESSRRETDNQSAEDDQRKKLQSKVATPRIPIIPPKPQTGRKRKSANGIGSVREKLCKEHGMESYRVSVNEASKKKAKNRPMSDRRLTEQPSTSVDPTKKFLTPRPSTQVPKEPKSSAPIPVKAKVTKKSRGDLFLKDFVGEENGPKEGTKKATSSSLPGFSIPRLPKTSNAERVSNDQDASNSASSSAHKRKYPGDDNESEPMGADSMESSETPSVSYSFKKPHVRVARRVSVSEDGDKNEASSGHSKHPSRYQDRSRDEAQPLGRNKKWVPPNSIRNVRREGREIPSLPGQHQHPAPSNSNASPMAPSNPNDETIPLPVPDDEIQRPRPISDNGMRGILKYQGLKNGLYRPKKVSIVEVKNKIHEIESRPPTPPLPTKTPVRPVDRVALTNDILYRICNWCYEWIEEQKKQKNDVPPPLLNALQRENDKSLPELSLLPVVSAYDSLEAYCSIFTPLMLHETWASLCKDMETSQHDSIRPLIYSKPKFCDGFALLQCEALSPIRIIDMELVTLTVHISPQKPPVKFFGVAEQVVTRNWRAEDVDPRLLETCQRQNVLYFRMSFVLWIKMSNVPKELDKIFSVTKISRLNTVVKQFILNAELACSPLCDVILHPSDYVDAFKLDTVDVEENHPVLNPCQYQAVESITRTMVCASDREPKVALLQGPPGTGKSHVIVELISRMMFTHYEKTNSFPRILVCAPSNNAIDEIANRLMIARDEKKSRYNIVRIGVLASMHPNVARISLDELTRKFQRDTIATKDSPESGKLRTLTEELHSLRKNKTNLIASIDAANKRGQSDEARMHGRKLEQLEIQIDGVDRSYQECYKTHAKYFNSDKERLAMKKHLISRAQIICTTLNSCRSREMETLFIEERSSKSFLCCILDEASQCTEPESLTPLAFGISKLVLIGDPDQLPATVTSQVAAKNRFDQSLFNRFYSNRMITNRENEEGVMMLNTQYRMAPSICEWPSKYFYGGKLVTAEGLIRNGPCYEYRVLNVIDGLEQLVDQSFKNENEAALVAKIVTLIVNSPLTRGKSVGVITFYRSQQQYIVKKMNEEVNRINASRVEVNTVDSFQGREKDIVIVSCVRAREVRNLGGDIGFVSSLQRMNVAMTRAKESLIVCGHFQTLQMNETWQDLINNARSRDVAHVVTSTYTSDNLRPLLFRPVPNV